MWDPALYLRYGGERSRPFFDLLARVGAELPSYVVDMGCGPGQLTAMLAERWPSAAVCGVDNSPQMIEAACAVPGRPDGRVSGLRTDPDQSCARAVVHARRY